MSKKCFSFVTQLYLLWTTKNGCSKIASISILISCVSYQSSDFISLYNLIQILIHRPFSDRGQFGVF